MFRSTIKLQTHRGEEVSCVVSIKDVGIGFPTKGIPFISDKCRKLGRSRGKGSGNGLDVGKHIVEAYGGKIWSGRAELAGSSLCFNLHLISSHDLVYSAWRRVGHSRRFGGGASQRCAAGLAIGWNILANGGSAVDAVEKSVNFMEDDPTFDAGRGSFVNSMGEIELDASIMDGTTFRAGAIAAVKNIRYPISLARVIMDKSEHILLAGQGAVRFAQEHGISQCSKEDLLVGRELERWKEMKNSKKNVSTKDAFRKKTPHDTVGAVALIATV